MALTTDPVRGGSPNPPAPPVGPALAVRRRSVLGSRRRKVVAALVVAGAVSFVVVEGLDNATEYYQTVPQAVAHRDKLGTKQFRIMGTVGPQIVHDGSGIHFSVYYGGVSAAVVETSQPSQLFKSGIKVVLEGHWSGTTFQSDLVMVKHDATYTPPTDPSPPPSSVTAQPRQ